MRSGYFSPNQFKGKAQKIMGKAESIDLVPSAVRKSARPQKSMYFTTPETSGRVKR